MSESQQTSTTDFRSADLPDNSIVVLNSHRVNRLETVYIKNHPTVISQWRGTNGAYASNDNLDYFIKKHGGYVLRHGSGVSK